MLRHGALLSQSEHLYSLQLRLCKHCWVLSRNKWTLALLTEKAPRLCQLPNDVLALCETMLASMGQSPARECANV